MQRIFSWLRWTLAAATAAVVALLCWQCIDIYQVGNSPANLDANGVYLTPVFTAEGVAERLENWSPVLVCYALLVLAGLAVQAVAAPVVQRTSIMPENRLRLMKARVAELPATAKSEERIRRTTCIAAGGAVLVCLAFSLAYMLNRSNFTSWDLEMVIGRMLLQAGPWALIGFAMVIVASFVCARSVERELTALKDAPKTSPQKPANGCWMPVNFLRIVIFAAAVVFIVLGVMNGGLYDVLVKAINICTECIGLG